MRLTVLLACSLGFASSALALNIGDKAPPLPAETWLNGTAVNPAKPDGKTTTIVEFWATWCAPCRVTIPELKKLQRDYADRDVIVAGVTYEADEVVLPFARKMEMDYRILIDIEKSTAETYMANVPGIPYAFIVDTNGIVVWQGHPMDGLGEVLDQVLAGTYSMDAAQKRMEKQATLQNLLMEEKLDEALALLDEMISEDRTEFSYYQLKLGILTHSGENIPAVKRLYRDIYDVFVDSPEQLNTLAWIAVTSPFELCDLQVAFDAARKATSLSKRENPSILDTLARVYYACGELQEAAAVQKEAVAIATDEEERNELQGSLEYYEDAMRVARTMMKEAGAP